MIRSIFKKRNEKSLFKFPFFPYFPFLPLLQTNSTAKVCTYKTLYSNERNFVYEKLNVAIVGLSFGLEFVPIYLEHPDVESLTLVETNVNLLRTVQERYGIPDENCFTDLQQVLDNPNIDAVHLVTPPSTHAPLSIKVLESGKHCGCTIPMGMSIDELHQVIAARKNPAKITCF